MDKITLYHVSYCFVDGFINVVCLKSIATQKIFFYCDMCGLAWAKIPHKLAKTADELENHEIIVFKKMFDWKHITTSEYVNNSGDDYFYSYYTGAKDIHWQELAPTGIAIPTLAELEKAGIGDDLIYYEERSWQKFQSDLWELWYTTYLAKNDLAAAMNLVNRIIAARPSSHSAYKYRAELHTILDNPQQAEEDLATSAKLKHQWLYPPPQSEQEIARRKAAIAASKERFAKREQIYAEKRHARKEHVRRRAEYLRSVDT